ncbi:unnamed protein product [Anisakis simplex]|uniref:SCP domain-containing protein n=1 Tax=Anisakis simplex TaxID=6269 RepID=A0A0M3JXZ6_ANISI|nr:unnamed protein product [Anisakis simplex]
MVLLQCDVWVPCSGSGRLSEEERQLILDEHNKYRSLLAKGQVVAAGNQLLRGARNMIKLTYDCNLETIAQNWINYCQFEHSDREFRKGAGENLYYAGTTGELNNRTQYLKDAAKAWWDEVKDIYESSLEEEKGGLKMTNAISYAGALHWSQVV